MRILQIPNYMYPNIGGIEQVARNLSNAIKNQTIAGEQVEQKIICFNSDASDGDYVCNRKDTVSTIVDGTEVIRCGCFTKVASQSISLSYPSELKKVMCSFKPNVVFFHYPNPYVSTFLMPYLSENFKFVLYWHLDITKQKVLRKLFQKQTIQLLQRADIVVPTSPNYIEGSPYLSKFKDKCVVVPNCIDTSRLLVTDAIKEKAQEIKKSANGKIICFGVGRHVPYKGFHYLIEASKYLDNRFAVVIGGEGELTQSLKIEAKNDSKIHFAGKLSNEELIAYYLACDIFCFPSITKNEAFGLALAEGMYFEKPAVTFTIPGSGVNFVSIDGVTGIECANCNSEEYAKALVHLAENKELRNQYAKAARKRVLDNFMFNEYKENILKVLGSL